MYAESGRIMLAVFKGGSFDGSSANHPDTGGDMTELLGGWGETKVPAKLSSATPSDHHH